MTLESRRAGREDQDSAKGLWPATCPYFGAPLFFRLPWRRGMEQGTVGAAEFAWKTNRSYSGVWQMIRDGRIIAVRDEAGRWRIPVSEIPRLLKPRVAGTDSTPVPA